MQKKNNSNPSFLYKNWEKIHSKTYYVSLILFAFSLPISEFGMSVSMLALFANWLLDIFFAYFLYKKPLSSKLKVFWKNKAAVLIFSLLIIHAIGIAYSEDIRHATKDVRIKFPIGVFALIIASEFKLSTKQLHTILLFFISSVLLGTIICYTYYLTNEVLNIRNISLFISHIRFGLMISLSIFLIFYLMVKERFAFSIRILLLMISIWFFVYLMLTENITGFTITLIISTIILFYFLIKSKNRILKFISIAAIIIIPLVTYFYLKGIYQDVFLIKPIDLKNLDKTTVNGNKYKNDTTIKESENGYYVWLYISQKELVNEWNKISSTDFYGKDKLEQDIRFTLIRYLTSKGYRKDSVGISKLTKADIAAVENGIANYKFITHSNLRSRLHKIFWEIKRYKAHKNASGHSVALRFEFWKTGLRIIEDNPIFGVGTGDIYLAYEKKYKELETNISEKWRFLSHNQFIYITISLGIIGLLWFLIVLFYPMIKMQKYNYFPYLVFFTIVFFSFFTEDTLTTQAGVCFYAFFNTLFLFNPQKN